MNTDNNKHTISDDTRWSIGREIISVLNSCTINLSVEQTLLELQISVERLTFGSESIGTDMTINDIDGLIAGDVSSDMIAFLRWLHHKRVLRIMMGANGRRFLAYCSEYYRKVQQVEVMTAIPLRDEFRIKILVHLRMKYPEPTRIVFSASPSLMAGCIVDDGNKRVDMSLLNRSPAFIGEYLKSQSTQRRNI